MCFLSESEESVWGGSAEGQRSDQLHLPDGREEVHRPGPIRPEGWGEWWQTNDPHWWKFVTLTAVYELLSLIMETPDESWKLWNTGLCFIKTWLTDVQRFPAQALASAISTTQVMTAQQVVKRENGDEVRFLFDCFKVLTVTLVTLFTC